ncbi:hypothetical protein OUZ56_029889 [Daphnia magna]|uniref:Uncharacterized protein n=1 Tax=Daphnia magna TaxID=35525 RepID=A0ABR0B864_9CRUS|nr:hypothetical protein OUZ56_029889 [Daphnia magna]
MYTVQVDIDTVPPSHHDGTCQCVEEYAREIVEEQIRSRNDQQDVEGTEKLPPIPTESIQEEPAVDPRNAMPETGHVSDQSTDEELWAGCRSQAKKSIDLVERNRAIVTPKALSSSLPMEKRVWETGVQEAAQELAMIQQENEYLVADGIITAEEAASAEAAITKSDLLPQTKKKKLGSSAIWKILSH